MFLFQTVGREIVPDIIFRDRTCLVFLFLGYVVKFQACEANSWPRSASSNPSNRVCVLFVFLSFFLFFFFSFLLLAFFLLYLSFIKLVKLSFYFSSSSVTTFLCNEESMTQSKIV